MLRGNDIYTKDGFWRRDYKTDWIFECLIKIDLLNDLNKEKFLNRHQGNLFIL